jgi:hypothetical protein
VKPRRKPNRCATCGRFLGNTNLGGYQHDKTSKRAAWAVCQACIDRADARACQ